MSYKPIDIQVMLPKVEQVARVQRVLQHQQQTDQQILGQSVQDQIHITQQAVQKTKETEGNNISGDDNSNNQQGSGKEKGKKEKEIDLEQEETVMKDCKGRHLDIKI